jgi:hypothetical protein
MTKILTGRLLNCWWSSPAHWFLVPSPTGLMNLFDCPTALEAFRTSGRKFYLRHYVQIGSEVHLVPCTMGTGREANHLPPSSAEVNIAWSYISTHPYFLWTWCLFKHKRNRTIIFYRRLSPGNKTEAVWSWPAPSSAEVGNATIHQVSPNFFDFPLIIIIPPLLHTYSSRPLWGVT